MSFNLYDRLFQIAETYGEEAAEDVKSLLLDTVAQITLARSSHTPEHKLHVDAPRFEYSCCERTDARERTIDEIETKKKELGLCRKSMSMSG